VKRIMLRHKGRLDISSKEGDGSCFTCIFPR
jgi:signal transduction histidine kinase